MKEIKICRESSDINVKIEGELICSVSLDQKSINGKNLYDNYDWDIDEKYELSVDSKPLEKKENDKNSLDFLHDNVYGFFEGLIVRIDEERELSSGKVSKLESRIEDKVKKLENFAIED